MSGFRTRPRAQFVAASAAALLFAQCCPPKKATTPAPAAPEAPRAAESSATPTTTATPEAPTPTRPGQPEVTVTQTAVAQQLDFPDEEFRRTQPGPSADRPFRMPAVKQFKTKSGLAVYLVENHTLPLIALDLAFEGGEIADPPGKAGLAEVCMAVLTEGTARLDTIGLSEALGDLAASVSAYASSDGLGLSLNTLSKNLDAAFALYSEVLLTPGWRQADFERQVKRHMESVKQSKASPGALLSRVAPVVQFGANHPLGAVTTEASLAAITVQDCKDFAAKALRPQGAKLFVVGDMTEAQVRAHFDGPALAAWKGQGLPRTKLAAATKPTARVYLVHVAGAAQSQVAAVAMGPKRLDKAYFANQMMSSVFGGGFTSRINMNLREDKGYSYGARGGFNYTRDFGTFMASASVRTDASYQSLLELHKEMTTLAQGKTPVTQAELDREKSGAILGLPGRFQTAAAALGQFRGLAYFGLPMNYYANYAASVKQTSLAQTNAAAQKQIDLANMVYIVVGDANASVIVRQDGKDVPLVRNGANLTLRQALDEFVASGTLGAGALVALDTDGQPVK